MFGGGFSLGGNSYVTYGEARAPAPAPAPTNVRGFKCYGTLLALMAATTLSLGIANVVLTREAYCNPWNDDDPTYCSSTKEPYIWTWVAPGIWGSVPIFLAGLFAICLSHDHFRWARMFSAFIFVSAIVFAPGMAVLSAIECWRGSASEYTFYTLDNGVKAGSIYPDSDDDNPYQAKFALPLVIAILACVMFVMTALVTLELCCCNQYLGIYSEASIGVYTGAPQVVAAPVQEVYYPGRPQVRNEVEVYRPSYYQPPAFRYSPVTSGVGYGNFPSRAQFAMSAGAGVYGSATPAYRWY